jgi:hypothetical protein
MSHESSFGRQEEPGSVDNLTRSVFDRHSLFTTTSRIRLSWPEKEPQVENRGRKQRHHLEYA